MKHVGGVLLFLCCVLLGSRLGSCAQALNPTENTVLEVCCHDIFIYSLLPTPPAACLRHN